MFEGFGSFISVPITNAGRHARILLSFDASLSVLGKRRNRKIHAKTTCPVSRLHIQVKIASAVTHRTADAARSTLLPLKSRYFTLFAFSALIFAQRSLLAFEIFALTAADMVRFRLTPL